MAKHAGVPNFLGSRTPVSSQLNVEEWAKVLGDYWDKQLIELIRYGFPLDFNRNCVLISFSFRPMSTPTSKKKKVMVPYWAPLMRTPLVIVTIHPL